MPPLKNSRYERLCFEIIMGASHAEAARRAGFSIKQARHIAYRTLRRPEIVARIEELRVETASERVMNIIDRKALLSTIARDSASKNPFAAIAALAEINRMEGSYAPEKSETTSKQVVVKTIEYFDAELPEPLEPEPAPPRITAP